MGVSQYLKWSAFYLLSIIVGSAVLTVLLIDGASLLNFDFLVWDAQVMYRIVQSGYDYYTAAFYPMFPLLWKWLSVGPAVISILNCMLFLVGVSILGSSLRLTRTSFLLHCSWPSVLFMILPYSEALLFVLTFCFMHFRGKGSWVVAGVFLFLMSITKPTAAIMLPALFFAEAMVCDSLPNCIRRILYFSVMILAGNLGVWYYQFCQTGEWMIFFRSQSEIWQQSLSFPTLPLATWDSNYVIWLDAAALYFTLLALVFSVLMLRDRILHGFRFDVSWCYAAIALAGTGMFVLCFRHGLLFSLNRFVFASAFFMYLAPRGPIRPEVYRVLSSIWLHIVVAVVVALLCGCYQHIRLAIAFTLLAILLVYYARHAWFRHNHYSAYIVLVFLWCFSVFYGYRILTYQWVA